MVKEKDKSIELRIIEGVSEMKQKFRQMQDSFNNVQKMLSALEAGYKSLNKSLKHVERVSFDGLNIGAIKQKSDQLSNEFKQLLQLYSLCPLNQQISSIKNIIQCVKQIKNSTGISQEEDAQLDRQRQNQSDSFQAQEIEDLETLQKFSSQLNTFLEVGFEERLREEESKNKILPERLAQKLIQKKISKDNEHEKQENLVNQGKISQQSKNILKLSSPAQVFSETLKKQILESNSEEHKEEQQLNNKQNEQYLSDNKTQEKKPQEITSLNQQPAQVERQEIQDSKGELSISLECQASNIDVQSSPQQDKSLELLLSKMQQEPSSEKISSNLDQLKEIKKENEVSENQDSQKVELNAEKVQLLENNLELLKLSKDEISIQIGRSYVYNQEESTIQYSSVVQQSLLAEERQGEVLVYEEKEQTLKIKKEKQEEPQKYENA